MSDLFPDDLLAALAHLRVEARRVPRGGRLAEHHARESGAGIEFRDHRAYAPGDDFRRVDWNLFRRFSRLFLRLADEVRDLPLHVFLDLSDSAWVEDPPRARAGRQAAGVLAAVSLNQLDPAGIFPFGAALGPVLPPLCGRSALPRVLSHLEDLKPLGRTDFAASCRELAALKLRPGLLAVVSDFFDPAGLEAATGALGALRHRLLLVRLGRRSDRDPSLAGDLRLRECESSATLDVTVTDAVRRRYLEAFTAFEENLRAFATRRNAGLLELDVERPVLAQFEPLFPDGVFHPSS